MPVTCTRCGKELPREDARFCSTCGAPVVSQSSHTELPFSQASNPPDSLLSAPQSSHQEYRHVLREQIARQPRPARLTRDISSANNAASLPQSLEHERPELHVRVWDREDVQAQSEMPIEDLPTLETPASPSTPPMPKAVPLSPTPFLGVEGVQLVQQNLADPEATHIAQRVPQSDYERFISSSLSARRTANSPSSPSFPDHSESESIPDQPTQANSVPVFRVVPPTPVLNNEPPSSPIVQQSAPVESPMQAPSIRLSPLSPLSPQIPSKRVRRSRGPLVFLVVVLIALIIASVAWVTIVQPFTVPSVTQPLQSYRNTQLGIALSYPSDWIITHSASSVLFSDSSQTAQAAITVVSASNAPSGNFGLYLQTQATKLGMTGAKTVTTVSFAGATWLHVQGNVQKSGVNNTETMFATIHNNQLFMLTQAAPQSVYADEERIIFSKMRASLQLL